MSKKYMCLKLGKEKSQRGVKGEEIPKKKKDGGQKMIILRMKKNIKCNAHTHVGCQYTIANAGQPLCFKHSVHFLCYIVILDLKCSIIGILGILSRSAKCSPKGLNTYRMPQSTSSNHLSVLCILHNLASTTSSSLPLTPVRV